MERYECLNEIYKTDKVIIFNGKQWGVRTFAQLFLERIRDNTIDHIPMFHFRRRFEATTGIDCSAFFEQKRFRPLVAAAIVEEFLECQKAEKYEDGTRYFFGHCIPD